MLQIHKDLEKHIWPLKPDEFKILEQNILEEGIRDRIVTWQGYIIDGHNRYKIAQKHNLPFDTIEKDFRDIKAVKDWIDSNQLGRRNLTKDQFEISIGRRYSKEKKAVGGRADRDFGVAKFTTPKTETKLADEYNISPKTVRNYAKKAEEFERS